MKILSKITYGIFITLLIAVAGLLLVSLLPLTGNVEIKIVKSGSMAPAIETGSLVVVMPAHEYKVGDVITFGKDTKTSIPTTHRIVSIRSEAEQTYYSTKGDANEEKDPSETAARDVIGKVLFHVPYAGFVLDFARQPTGFAFLIGIPAGIIILDEAFNIYKEISAMRRRRRGKGGKSGVLVQIEVPKKPQVFPVSFSTSRGTRQRIPTI